VHQIGTRGEKGQGLSLHVYTQSMTAARKGRSGRRENWKVEFSGAIPKWRGRVITKVPGDGPHWGKNTLAIGDWGKKD